VHYDEARHLQRSELSFLIFRRRYIRRTYTIVGSKSKESMNVEAQNKISYYENMI